MPPRHAEAPPTAHKLPKPARVLQKHLFAAPRLVLGKVQPPGQDAVPLADLVLVQVVLSDGYVGFANDTAFPGDGVEIVVVDFPRDLPRSLAANYLEFSNVASDASCILEPVLLEDGCQIGWFEPSR